METRLMPDVLDVREVTYTNLLLLGFQPDLYESKNRCPFNRDAFVFPNKKAMEQVFHFLFMKLNPDVAKDAFRDCWPILDKKRESTFRKVAAQWLNRLNREVDDSNIPRVVASVLLSPGGDKFYHLLLCFSSFVLKEEIKKIANKEDIVLPWPNTSSTAKSFPLHISKILTTKVALATERFLKTAKLSTQAQNEWIQFSSELTKENRDLKKKRREIDKDVKNLESEHLKRGLLIPAASQSPHHGSPYSGQIKSLKRTKVLQRIRGYWTRVNEMYESHKLLREKIDKIVHGSANKCILKSSDINIKIPDLLLRECEEDIYQKRIGNTIEGGRVNLLSLVQLLNLSLQLMLEQIRSHPLPVVSDDENDVREKLHAQSSYLQITRSLKDIIEKEMIPELKDSINELQEILELSSTIKPQFNSQTARSFDFGLTGLPLTPSVHLSSEVEIDSNEEATTLSKSLFSCENVPTPDAIKKMVRSLRDAQTETSPDDSTKREAVYRPPRASSTSKPKTSKQASRPRIPVLKAKTAAKQKIRKKINGQRDDSILNKVHQDVSAIRTEIMAAEKEGFVRRGNNGRNSEKETMNLNKREMENKFAREKAARDILAEKIASSVLSKGDFTRSSSSSSSSRSATPVEHGLEDPLSAISEDAFVARDAIQRTPLNRERRQSDDEMRDPQDALQSYLAPSLLNDVTTPKPRLFSESFAETPNNGLFQSPISTDTPKQSLFDGGEDKMRRISINKKVGKLEESWTRDESPAFDGELQTPIVNRAIESSVRASILRPRNRSRIPDLDGSFDELKPANDVQGNEGFSLNMLNLDCEAIDAKSPPKSNRKEAAMAKVAVPDKMNHRQANVGNEAVRSIEADEEKPGLVSSKEDLAELIKRYKHLKMKSKPVETAAPKSENDDALVRSTHQGVINEADDELDPFKANWDLATTETNVEKALLSVNGDESTSKQYQKSFLEIARNSAKKEASSWSFLKNQMIEDDDLSAKTDEFHCSFDDLQIPVAKQLSFLQMDTRPWSPDSRRNDQSLVAREQHSPADYVETGKLSDSDSVPTKRMNLDQPRNQVILGADLSLEDQSEVLSQGHFSMREERDRLPFDSQSLHRSRLEAEPRFEPEAELRTPFGNVAWVEKHFISAAKRTGTVDRPSARREYSVYETPKSKPFDESFNILTPGLELQRGVEMFAFDLESPGLSGVKGNRARDQDAIKNLIDF